MLLLSSIVTPNTICSCYIVAGSLVLESYKPAQSLDCEIKVVLFLIVLCGQVSRLAYLRKASCACVLVVVNAAQACTAGCITNVHKQNVTQLFYTISYSGGCQNVSLKNIDYPMSLFQEPHLKPNS